MYRVEMIPKQSVMDDILDFWLATGREDETSDGQFVFTDVDDVSQNYGTISIIKGSENYLYSVSDFYRIKIIDTE